jgi:signal transduction histidine kinase
VILRRVLLVEDNPGDAELVRIRLRDPPGEAHQLVVASTLEEALAELGRAPMDVALLDLNLPDSDGLDTLRAVRAAVEALPIVILTGTDDLDTAINALRFGADDYIPKSELARAGMLVRSLRYGIERHRTLTALQVAVRAREELLQVVSHDLRNHLNTINLAVRLLHDAGSPDVKRRVGAVERAAGTSLRLLDDLVDLAALETGGLAVNATLVDLEPLVRETHASFQPAADHKGVRLELDCLDGVLHAWADAVRVSQVLGNLIGNALKFTPAGGAIRLGARGTTESVVLHVKDSGPGVPAHDRSRLFERFFRGSNPVGKGAGLGLSIARALVEAQRGKIWLESEEGQGAAFFFSLPGASAPSSDGASGERGGRSHS